MITAADLADHLRFAVVPEDTSELQRAVDTAYAAILPYVIVADADLTTIQRQTLDQAVLKASGDLWRWKDSPNGDYTFADGAPMPFGMLRNVYWAVRPLLASAQLTEPGFA